MPTYIDDALYVWSSIPTPSFLAIYINQFFRLLVGLFFDQVVVQLFSADWEGGAFEGMKTVTETYADYFRDLHGWLSEYFFAKLARACYEKTLKVIIRFFIFVIPRRHSYRLHYPFGLLSVE